MRRPGRPGRPYGRIAAMGLAAGALATLLARRSRDRGPAGHAGMTGAPGEAGGAPGGPGVPGAFDVPVLDVPDVSDVPGVHRTADRRNPAPDRRARARDRRISVADRRASLLHRALAHDRIELLYQPIVTLPGGRIEAVEALMRITRPGRDPLPPAAFIPGAEQSGLIGALGARALDLACAQAGRWFHEHGVAFGVNVSGRQLGDEGFGELVSETLHRHGLPGRALILEITETVLLTGLPTGATEVVELLATLREQGVRVALDDFGTGYSSLSYLSALPVDIIKIDKSFVRALGRTGNDRRTLAFTWAMLNLAASLDLTVIAEGVENAEQAALLGEMGCRLAQGHHFHRPACPSDLDRGPFASR